MKNRIQYVVDTLGAVRWHPGMSGDLDRLCSIQSYAEAFAALDFLSSFIVEKLDAKKSIKKAALAEIDAASLELSKAENCGCIPNERVGNILPSNAQGPVDRAKAAVIEAHRQSLNGEVEGFATSDRSAADLRLLAVEARMRGDVDHADALEKAAAIVVESVRVAALRKERASAPVAEVSQ